MALKNISFIIVGLVLLFFSFPKKMQSTFVKEKVGGNPNMIEGSKEEAPLGYLNIPTLQISQPFYNLNSPLNDVSKNVQFIKSNLPDVENGNFILAAHSGNAKVSYFKNLHLLKLNDKISIWYQDKLYFYEVIDIYETLKKETVIKRPTDETTLTLVTCVTLTNRRYIVVAKQIADP